MPECRRREDARHVPATRSLAWRSRAGIGASEYFDGAMTTSDFPNILANVANKTLRQAYEAAPRTFVPFCRQVTAPTSSR